MTQTEGRVLTYAVRVTSLGERLFPDRPGDGFFERERRALFEEVLKRCLAGGGSVSVQQLIDFTRFYTPFLVQDCSEDFRAAMEVRWHGHQAAIIQALARARELGLEAISSV